MSPRNWRNSEGRFLLAVCGWGRYLRTDEPNDQGDGKSLMIFFARVALAVARRIEEYMADQGYFQESPKLEQAIFRQTEKCIAQVALITGDAGQSFSRHHFQHYRCYW